MPFKKTGQCNEVAEAKKIIADLQRENAELGTPFTRYPVGPERYNHMFWKKPIGDVETFKLVLFFVGNGCSPHLISEWILSSQLSALNYQPSIISSQLWNNFQKGVGSAGLCRHNFEHNTISGTSGIMLA